MDFPGGEGKGLKKSSRNQSWFQRDNLPHFWWESVLQNQSPTLVPAVFACSGLCSEAFRLNDWRRMLSIPREKGKINKTHWTKQSLWMNFYASRSAIIWKWLELRSRTPNLCTEYVLLMINVIAALCGRSPSRLILYFVRGCKYISSPAIEILGEVLHQRPMWALSAA